MVSKLFIGVSGILLIAAILAMSEQLHFLSGLVLLTLITVWTIALSPSSLFSGKHHELTDILVGMGFLVIASHGPVSLSFSIMLGVGLLFVASITSVYKSITFGKWLMAFVFYLGMYAAFFQTLLVMIEFLTADALIFLLILGLLFLVGIGSYMGHKSAAKLFTKILHELEAFKNLFHSTRHFPLGLAGLLVLLYTTIMAQSILSWLNRLHAQQLVSFAGVVCLAILPAYVWIKLFAIRTKKKHSLPNWHVASISIISGVIVSALFFPIATFANGHLVLRDVQPGVSAMLSIVFGLAVFLIWAVLGHLDTFLRKILMVGPIFASVVFFGMYVYDAFLTMFLTYGNMILLTAFVGRYVMLIPFLLLFFVNAFFLAAGFISFLYETWRD